MGVDVVRLNFSHGTHDEHAASFHTVRKIAASLGQPVAIMQDLQGPKIRTGLLAGGGPVTLHEGTTFRITTDDVPGAADRVSTTYPHLPEDVAPGDRILLDDGHMELRVTDVEGADVVTTVVHGGQLGEHKGINLPGVTVSSPALTEKDLTDLAFGVALGVDYVAISFVRSAHDVRLARAALKRLGAATPLIAKIEKPEALDDLAGVIEAADGVMVARGDLGVELSPERVPSAQKRIIRMANARGKVVITATQMLESMTTNPQPTRAEASDVFNAILDGTDAVMLSGETAIGHYPVETVRMMQRIAAQAEIALPDWQRRDMPGRSSLSRAIADAAVRLACDTRARALVVVTRSGYTARLISSLRPPMPIIALELLARDPEAHDDAWAGLGYASVAAGKPAAARQAWYRARDAYRARGRHWTVGSIALEELDSICLAYEAHDRDARERIAAESEQAYRRAEGGFVAEDFARTARLPLLMLEGEWAAARRIAEDLAPYPSVAQMYLHYVLGVLHRHQGRPQEAWAIVRAVLPKGLASEPGDYLFHEGLDTVRLAVELALDERDLDLARRWLEMHSRWLTWSGALRRQSEDALAWARYYRLMDDRPRAGQHVEMAVARARTPYQPLALLAALRMAGELDTEEGHPDAAAEHLREALALADACAARYERALTLLALAELRATEGRQDDARPLLDEARATLAVLAAAPALARADALATRIGAPSGQMALAADLTAREADVLRLLTAGKSNKEIAHDLSVSVRTAERHIANLYIKIDAAGRAEAIAFAHQHGLT
jgi:pyruvate kinase